RDAGGHFGRRGFLGETHGGEIKAEGRGIAGRRRSDPVRMTVSPVRWRRKPPPDPAPGARKTAREIVTFGTLNGHPGRMNTTLSRPFLRKVPRPMAKKPAPKSASKSPKKTAGKKMKVVLAYSGGLDTSVIIP